MLNTQNDILLNYPWVKSETIREIKKYLENNNNENICGTSLSQFLDENFKYIYMDSRNVKK